MKRSIWNLLQRLEEEGKDCVVVTVTGSRGSVPAEPGNKAVFTSSGLHEGTVGGGKVEVRAGELASDLLRNPASSACETRCWNLRHDIGMTCGGEITLLFEVHRASPPWRIVIFGAGHVSQALVPVLSRLACHLTVIDTRADWLQKLPREDRLKCLLVEKFEDGVAAVPPDAAVASITHGHSSDFPVLRDLLSREQPPPFLGVIGSLSKRATLLRELREAGIPEETSARLVCPLGLPIGGNSPQEIAISIAAQLLQARDS